MRNSALTEGMVGEGYVEIVYSDYGYFVHVGEWWGGMGYVQLMELDILYFTQTNYVGAFV